jgi:hypothetical protein
MSYWLMALAAVAAAQGRLHQVAALLGAAETLCKGSGTPLAIPEYLMRDELRDDMDVPRLVANARAGLGRGDFDAAWQAGAARSLADVILDPFETAEDAWSVRRARKAGSAVVGEPG